MTYDPLFDEAVVGNKRPVRTPKEYTFADEFEGFFGMSPEEQNKFAIQHPKTYALTGTLQSLMVDTIRHLKYLIPNERDKFMKLSEAEQRKALLWDAFGTTIGVGTMAYGRLPVFRAGGSTGILAAGRGALAARKLKKFPVEDVLSHINKKTRSVKVKPFSYDEMAGKKLRDIGFNADEINALKSTLKSGDRGPLKQVTVERAFANKKPSKAWKKNIEATGEPYGGFRPKDKLLRELNERDLHTRHWKSQMNSVLSREIIGKEFPTKDFPKFVYEKTARKVLKKQLRAQKEGAKLENISISYDDINAEGMQRVILEMLRRPGAVKSSYKPGAGRLWFTATLPQRTVFGTGEELLGTYTNVYKPTKAAMEETKDYAFHKTFTWQKMLEQRGLGTVKFKKNGSYKFKPAKGFDVRVADDAYRILRKRDDLTEAFRRKSINQEEMQHQMKELFRDIDPQSPVKKVIETWDDFSDTLYGEFAHFKLRDNLIESGLTEVGMDGLDIMMAKLHPRVIKNFSTHGSRGFVDKSIELNDILGEVKKVLHPLKDGTHPWFKEEGKALTRKLEKLRNLYTPQDKGGDWIGYLENYTARITKDNTAMADDWTSMLARKSGFEKTRKSEFLVGEAVDFSTMIEGRISSQARAMHLNKPIAGVVKFANELPASWAKHTEHYISRLLGRSSVADEAVANFLNRALPRANMDAKRVMRAAQAVNNLTYLGALGFKPFSAARNLFQPLITLPGDLGGVKDYRHLAKGLKRALEPKTRKYIRDIGAITEYAPEITTKQRALPFGKLRKVNGKSFVVPRLEAARDVGMWMFRGSDEINRYISGGAALNKWEAALSKTPLINKSTVTGFMKGSGANGRNPWIKNEIRDLLMRGQADEAKKLFVKDVIADTQFLYGSVDSPILMSRGGVGSTITLFQSWWMNYGAMLDKFLVTGQAPTKVKRMFTWYLSGAIARNMMEPLWGERTAKRSTQLGPMPGEFNEFMIPPAWTPIYRALKVGLAATDANPDATSKEMRKFFSSLAIFFPAGLQIKKTSRAVKDEGFEGFAPSILGLKRPKDE